MAHDLQRNKLNVTNLFYGKLFTRLMSFFLGRQADLRSPCISKINHMLGRRYTIFHAKGFITFDTVLLYILRYYDVCLLAVWYFLAVRSFDFVFRASIRPSVRLCICSFLFYSSWLVFFLLLFYLYVNFSSIVVLFFWVLFVLFVTV